MKVASDRWRASLKKNGLSGLNNTICNSSGRPRVRELTNEEILKKKDAEIVYLKVEIELLKN